MVLNDSQVPGQESTAERGEGGGGERPTDGYVAIAQQLTRVSGCLDSTICSQRSFPSLLRVLFVESA